MARPIRFEFSTFGSAIAPGLSAGALGAGRRTLDFPVKRSHLTKESAASIVHQAKAISRLLIMAPVIGQDLGELFVMEHVNHVDLAGNWVSAAI